MAVFSKGQSDWNGAYGKGDWQYLATDVSELSRQALVASLIKIDSDFGAYSVLEMGCGEGMLRQFLAPDSMYLGVDISDEAAKTANELYKDKAFKIGDIGSQSFLNSLFTSEIVYDYIVLNEVLYYLDDGEMSNVCNFLIRATKEWDSPTIIVSICRTDIQPIRHGSYYWSRLFELLSHKASLEIADHRHRWDIKSFQGLKVHPEDHQ